MQYKTIALELLRQNPQVHEQLRQNRILLQAVNACAADLKARHHAWMDELRATRPQSDATQISSEALELALDDLQRSWPQTVPAEAEQPLSLDAAMTFIRLHTPPA